MRILYLNTTYAGGGAERVTRQIYEGMQRRGHEVFEIVCYNRKGRILDDHIHVLYAGIAGKLLQRIQTRNRSNENLTIPYALHYILSFIKRNQIDIVHLNNPHDSFLGIRDIGRIAGYCPMVWTLHDMWALTGHCAVPLGCENRWMNGCLECERLESYPRLRRDVSHKLYEEKKKTFSKARIHFVVPSKWMKTQVERSYLCEKPCECISNSLDLDKWKALEKEAVRKQYGLNTEKIVLGFVAADLNNPTKGMNFLLDALKQMDSEKWFLVTAGKMDSRTEEYIGRFECLDFGYISEQKEMNEFYALADVVVNPSLFETFGLVNLEALASGTPVIAFQVCAAPEIVNPQTGWCLEISGEAGLRKQLEYLEKNPDILIEKRGHCRDYINRDFGEKDMLDRYEHVYRELLNR